MSRKEPRTTVKRRLITPKGKIMISQQLASQSWSCVLNEPGLNKKVTNFHQTVNAILDQHCPLRSIRVRNGEPTLETPLTIKLRRAQHRLYKMGNPTWKFMAKLLQSKLKQQKRFHSEKNINCMLTNSKQWWAMSKESVILFNLNIIPECT